jgi:hypothetical protein
VRWEGKIYKTAGYLEIGKRYTSEYDENVNVVLLVCEDRVRRPASLKEIENITANYKREKMKEYIIRKVEKMRQKKVHNALEVLGPWILHWACKPGGPIYNLSIQRLSILCGESL